MNGMILSHAIGLLECIALHTEFIAQRMRTMSRSYLSNEVKAEAGKELIDLLTERRAYWEELEEILDHYYTDSLISELYDLPRI